MKAYVFPGQGSQFEGMGKICTTADGGSGVDETASTDPFGFRITDVMFGGSADDLKQTRVTQLPFSFIPSPKGWQLAFLRMRLPLTICWASFRPGSCRLLCLEGSNSFTPRPGGCRKPEAVESTMAAIWGWKKSWRRYAAI